MPLIYDRDLAALIEDAHREMRGQSAIQGDGVNHRVLAAIGVNA